MATKLKPLSAKQVRIIEQKLQGKTDQEIGVIEYPDANPDSARVMVTTQLNKPHVIHYMNQNKQVAIFNAGIDWQKILQPIADALQATKTATNNGELYETDIPDHTTRLAASKRAQELIESLQEQTPQNPTPLLKEQYDETELQRIIFRKNTTKDTDTKVSKEKGAVL